MFFGCTTILQCWRVTCLSSIIDPRVHVFNDAKSFLLDIYNKEDKRDAGIFVAMINVLWKNINNVVWNNPREEVSKIGLQAFFNW